MSRLRPSSSEGSDLTASETLTPGVSANSSDLGADIDSAPTSPTPSSLAVGKLPATGGHDAAVASAADAPHGGDSSAVGASAHVPRQPGDRRTGSAGYRFATTCATVEDPHHKDQYGASSTPIYMSATFKGLPGAEFDYSRSGNPTRSMLQHHLCQIQSCRYSFAVSSGMACLDIITRLLKAGDRIIAGDDLYGGTNRLLTYLRTHGDIETDHVDTTDASAVEAMLKRRAEDHKLGVTGPVRMVLLETPTNPLLKICDLRRCAAAAKEWAPDALVVVDNTMMSPYLMRPLELGVDVVYDSGTKYLSGHHDLMAGVVACDRDDVGQRIAFVINSVGNALTPMDSFLLLRGIKTMAIRMEQQQRSAIVVAHYLESLGFKVNYPGLASHPSKAIHDAQASGPGAVLSFETGDKNLSERIVGAARLWGISVSFGCVNSLISMPCLMSHASIDPKVRAARGMPEDLIRLCVGIEDCRDLIEDLEAALVQAGAIRRRTVGLDLTSTARSTATQTTAGEPLSVESVQRSARQFERPPATSDVTDRSVEKLTGGLDAAKIETRGGEPDTRGAAGGGVAAQASTGAATSSHKVPAPSTILVSAPGKVILFGEHAVVHGVTAVAASVALRCYALVRPRSDGVVGLHVPDLNSDHTWEIAKLPWQHLKRGSGGEDDVENPGEELDSKLLKALEAHVGDTVDESERSHATSVAFLYLFMLIAGKACPGSSFTLRSTLPIGAGLGSSAAFSSCISSALLYTSGVLPLPSEGEAISTPVARLINAYSFLAEKILHGNPSGVDNSVATFGGALAFARAHERTKRKEAEMRNLKGFTSVRFLLTDTRVGRDTKSLVAGVGRLLQEKPTEVGKILDEIQAISDEAVELLGGAGDEVGGGKAATAKHTLSRHAQLERLSALMKVNHSRLVSLGVSHPSLERIVSLTSEAGLVTKLTGAGGGGCAVTLIPDDFDEKAVGELRESLERVGFECYETRVGGPGVGAVFRPLHNKRFERGEVRPDDEAQVDMGVREGLNNPDVERLFVDAGVEDFRDWAESVGSWNFA